MQMEVHCDAQRHAEKHIYDYQNPRNILRGQIAKVVEIFREIYLLTP